MDEAMQMKQSQPLESPPLVEVILEVRWQLREGDHPSVRRDPHYSLVVGKLHAKISDDYPFHEQLPAAMVPDEISAYTVKHRFRVAKGQWPLVQIGPGVLTLNETKKYTTFQDFRPRAEKLVQEFFAVYPETPAITMVLLRYIDAVDFDHRTQDVWDFLRDKMRVPVRLPEEFFRDSGVGPRPRSFLWEASFSCQRPKGTASLRFATGERKGSPVLTWEQMVRTTDDDVPPMPDGFADWLENAHAVTKAWFLRLINGELRERFSK
jgi:uncharacterized protein (TIGR04255 family)